MTSSLAFSDSSARARAAESCPSCETEAVAIGHSKHAEVFRCPKCDLWFLPRSLRGNAERDNAWYQHFLANREWAPRFVQQMRGPYTRQLRLLSRYAEGRKILDIGCGIGVFAAVAQEEGWQVTCAEESEAGRRFGEACYGLRYEARLENVPPGSQNIVRLSHVLEHIPEPNTFLAAIDRVLAPDGVLAVIVPNREPLCAMLINRARRLRNPRPALTGAVYPDMHVLGFSKGSLRALATRMGFKPLLVQTVSMGDSTYFPLFYDGLLNIRPLSTISARELVRYWLPMAANRLGNPVGRGEWVVGLFRKAR